MVREIKTKQVLGQASKAVRWLIEKMILEAVEAKGIDRVHAFMKELQAEASESNAPFSGDMRTLMNSAFPDILLGIVVQRNAQAVVPRVTPLNSTVPVAQAGYGEVPDPSPEAVAMRSKISGSTGEFARWCLTTHRDRLTEMHNITNRDGRIPFPRVEDAVHTFKDGRMIVAIGGQNIPDGAGYKAYMVEYNGKSSLDSQQYLCEGETGNGEKILCRTFKPYIGHTTNVKNEIVMRMFHYIDGAPVRIISRDHKGNVKIELCAVLRNGKLVAITEKEYGLILRRMVPIKKAKAS